MEYVFCCPKCGATYSLPSPDVLADDIIENLQSALESFQELKAQLK